MRHSRAPPRRPRPAIGYDYAASGANFASVLLPVVGDSDKYELWLWDGGWVLDGNVPAGTAHAFAAGGVARFRILGIDPNAGLDPEDPTAFVTGLTFTHTGPVDVTMNAYVPEPTALALLLLGTAACLKRRRAR